MELPHGISWLTPLTLWIWNNCVLQRLVFKWPPIILHFLRQQIQWVLVFSTLHCAITVVKFKCQRVKILFCWISLICWIYPNASKVSFAILQYVYSVCACSQHAETVCPYYTVMTLNCTPIPFCVQHTLCSPECKTTSNLRQRPKTHLPRDKMYLFKSWHPQK